jgi:sporulation protein YlmC with PRC-barrel domain
MADIKDPSNTGGKLIAASKVNGTSVYDSAGEKVGTIYDVMIDKVSGKADYAIMSFGGFFGMGSDYHPLPWRTLTYDESKEGYVVNINKQQLEGAPVYADTGRDMWADPNYGRQVDAYYNW